MFNILLCASIGFISASFSIIQPSQPQSPSTTPVTIPVPQNIGDTRELDEIRHPHSHIQTPHQAILQNHRTFNRTTQPANARLVTVACITTILGLTLGTTAILYQPGSLCHIAPKKLC